MTTSHRSSLSLLHPGQSSSADGLRTTLVAGALAQRTWVSRSAWLLMGSLLTACASTTLPQAPAEPAAAEAGAVTTAPAPLPLAAAVAPAASAKPSSSAVVLADSALVTIDPLDPTVRVDLNNPTAHTDLWRRVRAGFKLSDLNNDHVRKWEQWYGARPDYVQRMTERGGRYMFHIVEELNRRGMPAELALLPFIESAYNPQAMSVAKASGMWQFIPGTGRDFALKQNVFRDDRRDVLASTRAALDYLQTLHGMFGDWHLALAAYNWGQGNVQKAINRNRSAGLPTDYDSLRMPDETRNYVPKLQAVKNIVMKPEAFGVALTPLKNHPYFISVGIDRDIDVERAARLAELPLDEFKALNPQMNKPVILAAGTPQVLLPYDNANQFVRALQRHKGPLASWTAWVAPKTMKPAQVAAQLGMPEDQLRAVNNIPPRMLVKAGSTLLVARDSQRQADVVESVADNATLALAPDIPPFKQLSFKAGRKGDSVAAVARRYRVSPTQVAMWNKTAAGARFKPGQAIVVMVPQHVGGRAFAKAGRGKAAVAMAHGTGAKAGKLAKAGPVHVAGRSSVGRKLVKPGPTARTRHP